MSKIKKGRIIRGTVSGIESYGAFVSCDDYYTGLIHISEMSHGFVKDINDFVKVGDLMSIVDINLISKRGCAICTPVVFVNYDKFNFEFKFGPVTAGKSEIALYELK